MVYILEDLKCFHRVYCFSSNNDGFTKAYINTLRNFNGTEKCLIEKKDVWCGSVKEKHADITSCYV